MKTLQQYEEELTANIDTVILLGQLGYNKSDLEELRAGFRPLFDDSTADGLRTVGARYPKTFALYLVLEGIYYYNGGDYWTTPEQTLKLTFHNSKMKAGDLFRETLRFNRLPVFENLGGLKNVTPILAHGGIPNYCLNDFFDLLDRARRQDASTDAPALLDQWAADGFPISIDKPIQRFLLYGSDVAEEFVERCLVLWEGDADPESLDLPRRVLESFDRWRDEHPVRDDGRRSIRLSRPRLTFDPYGESIAIILPTAHYQTDAAPQKFSWVVEVGERHYEEGTWRRHLRGEVEFTPRAGVNVLTVAPVYTVTALADDVPLQTWKLPGLGEPPLLAFDYKTSELLPDRQTRDKSAYWITPGERHLVFPRDWAVKPQGAHKLVELPNPGGRWEAYTFETWELELDGRLDVTSPTNESVAFRARNDRPPDRPFLDGAPLLPHTVEEPSDLYNGKPPMLNIPPGRTAHNPAKWRITITPVGAADPPDRRSFSLANLPQYCVVVEKHVLLSLDAPELLGASPLGEFHVRLRGPYGRHAEFQLRFAPGLEFEGYPQLYLAADDASTNFLITLPADLELVSDDPDVILGDPVIDGVSVTRRITAAASLTRLPLTLRGERGELGFDLPAYRLRFGLVEPERTEKFHWQTTPLRLHPDALDTPHSAILRVDLPPLLDVSSPTDIHRAIGWRLVDAEGRELQASPPRPTSRYPQTNLIAWLDTFRETGSAVSLQLVITDDRESGIEESVTLAYLLPTLELGKVSTDWRRGPDGDQVSIAWELGSRVRNRWLRLWPTDGRSWIAAPIALAVPDETHDFASWSLPPGALPIGDYLAEMVVVDPWTATATPTRPTADTPNTFLLQPAEVDASLDEALARARRDELTNEDALAWIVFLAGRRPDSPIARFTVTLWRGCGALSAEQLLAWTDAAARTNDETAYRIARKALFEHVRPDELTAMTEARRAAFFVHLPDNLELDAYRTLLPLAEGEPRRTCLAALCRAGDETGFEAVVAGAIAEALAGETGKESDEAARAAQLAPAVELLLLSPRKATDYLCDILDELSSSKRPRSFASISRGDITGALLSLLLLRSPSDDIIAKGCKLETNVGIVFVSGIKYSDGFQDAYFCRISRNDRLVLGKLWPDSSNLPMKINMAQQSIIVFGRPLFRCQFNGLPTCDYVFRNENELKRHYRQFHKIDYSQVDPIKSQLKLDLTHLAIIGREAK